MISRIDVGMVMALSCTYLHIKKCYREKKNIQNLGDRKSSDRHYIIGILYMRNTKRVIII